MDYPLQPESIRGSWYALPEEGDPSEVIDAGKSELLAFRLDGSFTRYDLKGNETRERETGDYTFDGQFLILRARNTETYRVLVEQFWFWNLQGKKKSKRLYRALPPEAGAQTQARLERDEQREIRILPVRAAVRAPFGAGDDAIYDLVFKPSEGPERRIGALFAQRQDDDALWIGLTPLAAGIESKTWQRIVRESYLDLYCGKPDDVRVVTVRHLDTHESTTFNYQVSP